LSATAIHELESLEPDALGESPEVWLESLEGPTWLRVPGRDRSRCRALTTLLHGNEPSGLRALHHWLREKPVPAVDLVGCVLSVGAARSGPRFSNRSRPGGRDLNRCFGDPNLTGPEAALARELLERLRAARPEALIDLHNTSGNGPAYGVATAGEVAQRALAGLFSRHLVVTDLRLGALAEVASAICPAITLECGGADDPRSDAIALAGLRRYAAAARVAAEDTQTPPADLLLHPIRVELAEGASVAYDRRARAGVDVTLLPDIDRHNFGAIEAGETLGWLGPRGLAALCVRTGTGPLSANAFLRAEAGRLLCARRFRPLMITTSPRIAQEDCLFYLVIDDVG